MNDIILFSRIAKEGAEWDSLQSDNELFIYIFIKRKQKIIHTIHSTVVAVGYFNLIKKNT